MSAGEDFEDFVPCPNVAPTCASGEIDTSVGTFKGLGSGSGASQVAPTSGIVVRTSSPPPFGRFNVTPGGANWLDSNDFSGIFWTVMTPPGTSLTRLAFLLTDVDDVGPVLFKIVANGTSLTQTTVNRPAPANLGNNALILVTMLFSAPTDDVTIELINGSGDGFGIDGIRMAAVPLPAGGLLLLAGLGGLALLRRSRRA